MTAEQKRIKELEAVLEKSNIAVPVELKGEYTDTETGIKWAFRKGFGHKITMKGKVRDKNEVIKDKELMTYLIESETALIYKVGEVTAVDQGSGEGSEEDSGE